MDWSKCNAVISGYSGPAIPSLSCIFYLIQTIISWLLTFAGVIALVLIIYSGIKFITSGGDAKQVDVARKTLTYAIGGLLLVLLSFFIINIISYATGVDCIRLLGFNACPQ